MRVLAGLGITLTLAAALVLSTSTVAADDVSCPGMTDMTTISSLQQCVLHAAQTGLIDNDGVANSLISELNAAQAALDLGQTNTAVNLLQAFRQEVEAQAGVHIDASRAEHMLLHAQMVIDALLG